MYQPPLSETGEKRLTTMRETEDGFRIAEVDLEMRGAGDLIGVRLLAFVLLLRPQGIGGKAAA